VGEPIPLSVWPTAQQTSRAQRAGRYIPASIAHPAKMLPAIARHAISAYTHPGDIVADPMCGIGTTIVEAVHLDRHAVGVEYEPRWANLARVNLDHASAHGATGDGQVHTGDGRDLPRFLPAELHGHVALAVTSPPYGASVHGHVTATPGHGVAKRNDRYTPRARGSGNLAHTSDAGLLDAFTDILAAACSVLRPGGIVAITTRPWRRHGLLIDFPAAATTAAEHAGLTLIERNVALLAGLQDDRLVPRASFFQLTHVRNARARSIPLRVIAHEDVLVFGAAPPSTGSRAHSGRPHLAASDLDGSAPDIVRQSHISMSHQGAQSWIPSTKSDRSSPPTSTS
jgi:hypothetical protein